MLTRICFRLGPVYDSPAAYVNGKLQKKCLVLVFVGTHSTAQSGKLSRIIPVNNTQQSLELNDVALSRGGRQLTSGLSFSLAPGQLALIIGPNGSGKTTLLRTIAGLARPSAGWIRLGDRDVASPDPDGCAQIVYQAHLEGLKKDLTVEENIQFYSELHSIDKVDWEYLAALNLHAVRGRKVRYLSAGQKRRVTLAILATIQAPVWLLDEPLTNLDPAGRALVSTWLDGHLERGGLAVIATHLVEELQRPGSLLVEL